MSMNRKSAKRGETILAVEVTNISRHGFWLLLGDQERFVPFKAFPWFRDASVADLTAVQLPSPHHLRWPKLDIDLAVDSLDHPERYPLISRGRGARAVTATAAGVKERAAAYKRRRRVPTK